MELMTGISDTKISSSLLSEAFDRVDPFVEDIIELEKSEKGSMVLGSTQPPLAAIEQSAPLSDGPKHLASLVASVQGQASSWGGAGPPPYGSGSGRS